MKKIISIAGLTLILFLAANSVQAHDLTIITAGSAATITDTGGSGTLTVSTSPGVQVAYATTKATYVLMGLNTSTQVADQNEYGIFSGYSGYYQHNTAAANTFGITTVGYSDADTDLSDPFAAWTAMGGAGSASGT